MINKKCTRVHEAFINSCMISGFINLLSPNPDFVNHTHHTIKRFNFKISSIIISDVFFTASLVPTCRKITSGFFFKRGPTFLYICSTVDPGNDLTFTVFFTLVLSLCSSKLLIIESPIINIVFGGHLLVMFNSCSNCFEVSSL